jgi:hypothetical protein
VLIRNAIARRGALVLAAYTGPVASGTFFPQEPYFSAGVTGVNSLTPHWTTEAVPSVQLVYANVVAKDMGAGVIENTTNLVALNITAVIEYPAGTYTRVKKAGVNTMPIAIGGLLVTDAAAVSIPANTKYMVHTFYAKQGGGDVVVPGVYGVGNSAFFNNGPADSTGALSLLGSAYAQGTSWHMGPCAILGTTTKRTFALKGDSRTLGSQDGPSDTNKGCTGETARAVYAGGYGFLNLGVGFDRADKYIASHTLRLQLAGYCSDVVLGYGVNDMANGRVTAQLQADNQTIIGYFPGKRIYMYTLPPIATTSSDNYATLANQTINFPEFERRLYNTAIRGGVTGTVRVWEIARVLNPTDDGKWRVDLGLVNGYPAADPTHENALGNSTIAASGAINLAP